MLPLATSSALMQYNCVIACLSLLAALKYIPLITLHSQPLQVGAVID
jgi:hypothetical protein